MKYYAWSRNGDCSDPFDTIEEAEDEAYVRNYQYVVVGLPHESVDIVLDTGNSDAGEYDCADLFDLVNRGL